MRNDMSHSSRGMPAHILFGLILHLCCGAVGAASETVPSSPPASEDGCEWRRCEIEAGPLNCHDQGQVCDMFRNRCVDVCQGPGCCARVHCPEGAVCMPLVGRCGVPAGAECHDLGTSWWTGRDLPPRPQGPLQAPVSVTFEVRNDTLGPLYFESMLNTPLYFNLYARDCGRERKLELPENHFCPTRCPEQGPVMERDCAMPPRIFRRLAAGQSMSLIWSGSEEVGMRRQCGDRPSQFCRVDRVTVSGTYSVEVCAYEGVSGGRPYDDNPDQLIMATAVGVPHCRRVQFRHPEMNTVTVRLGT